MSVLRGALHVDAVTTEGAETRNAKKHQHHHSESLQEGLSCVCWARQAVCLPVPLSMEETGRAVPSLSEWRTSTSWSRRLDASSDASPHSTGEVIGISDSRWEATKEALKRRVIAALNAAPGTVTHVGIVCDPDRKEFVRDVQQYFTSDPHTGGMYPSVLLVDTTRLTRSNSAKSEEIPYSLENNVLTLKITALSPGEMPFYSTARVRGTGTKLPFETVALQMQPSLLGMLYVVPLMSQGNDGEARRSMWTAKVVVCYSSLARRRSISRGRLLWISYVLRHHL